MNGKRDGEQTTRWIGTNSFLIYGGLSWFNESLYIYAWTMGLTFIGYIEFQYITDVNFISWENDISENVIMIN